MSAPHPKPYTNTYHRPARTPRLPPAPPHGRAWFVPDASPIAAKARLPLFVLTIFTGSLLLFLVQPMVARMALPLLGGAPAVWNSALVVFQLLLLAGYGYAHLLARWPVRRQAIVHLALLALAGLTVPLRLADLPPPAAGWEVLWVPALFAATVAPVFVLLSAGSSLLQRWYAAAGVEPYRLYAVSNLGSFAGLIAYPFWLERDFAVSGQTAIWAVGYGVLVLLVALAAVARWRVAETTAPAVAPAAPIGWRRVALWLALSAVPSGLLLSTTTLLTTDLMAMPLLWVIPLAAYLLSFTVAFGSGDSIWLSILNRYAPVLLLMIGGLAMISGGQANPAVALAAVALLFVLAVALHGRLYALRPEPARLTLFYLVMASGGALGGIFAALLAPVLFDWVYEHALLLLAAALLIPQASLVPAVGRLWQGARWRHGAAALLVVVAALLAWRLAAAVEARGGADIFLYVALLVTLGIIATGHRIAFTVIFALLLLGHGGLSTLALSASGARTRSYFGVYSITDAANGQLRRLNHGTTMHGEQWQVPARRLSPTGYYGPESGVGLALDAAATDARVGVVGLGVGTLACYKQAGQAWTFFEIDPQVLALSRQGTFTFLNDCAPDARVVIGDARISLARAPAGGLDLLAVDAFSSDAIPVHLLTREAFAIYGRALAADGVMLVHISNRYLDLAPMVAAQARDGGWRGLLRDDPGTGTGLSPSIWIALARNPAALDRLAASGASRWEPLPAPAAEAWTDDRSSLLELLRY
jgi:SAM-dependent methyltransferase